MKLTDYSPPESPSLAQQRDALRKGLGRAMQWALAGRLDEAILLDACLNDWRFDAQVDDGRGDWIWRLIEAVGAEARFRLPILDALRQFSDWRAADQLCELALHYALRGDDEFRKRLYEFVETRPLADLPWLAEEPIIRLDGEAGFLFGARIRGEELQKRDWDWDDGYLITRAGEQFGKDRVTQLLDEATDESIKRFRDCSRKDQTAELPKHVPHSERMKQIPLSEIVSKADSGERMYGIFLGWGKYAAEEDLDTIGQRLLAAQSPRVIANYLAVFANGDCLRFIPQFIELCRHRDDEVRRRAFSALEKTTDPAIRHFAEEQLRQRMPDRSVISLFIKNYQQGDEHRIVESLDLPDNVNELHWMLMDVTKVLENNPQASCSELGVLAYALTPCGNCRYIAARLLHARAVVPSWLTEECRFDTESDTRKLAEEIPSNSSNDSISS